MAKCKQGSRVGLAFLMIMISLLPSVISQGAGAIRYPATIKTKGSSTAGTAQVTLTNYDSLESIAFSYEALLDMGSTVKLDIKGSTSDGSKTIQSGKQPGEDYTRSVVQKVSKSQDGGFIALSVNIQTTLRYRDGKEKYGKTSIGVRVKSGAHYWDIKHEYSNNYDGEGEGELCLGCTESPAPPPPPPPTRPPPSKPPGPGPGPGPQPGPGEDGWGSAFVYKWDVEDSPSQNLYSSSADSNGEVIRGEYKTLLADGRTQVVTYTADWKNGYVPKVTYT